MFSVFPERWQGVDADRAKERLDFPRFFQARDRRTSLPTRLERSYVFSAFPGGGRALMPTGLRSSWIFSGFFRQGIAGLHCRAGWSATTVPLFLSGEIAEFCYRPGFGLVRQESPQICKPGAALRRTITPGCCQARMKRLALASAASRLCPAQ